MGFKYPGMIVAVVILLMLGLTAVVLASPQGQQFTHMFSGSSLTGGYGQGGFGMP